MPNLKSNDGFILPVTLFVLAAILIAVGWYGSWTSTMLKKANEQADAAQFEQDWRSTYAILMYNISLGETSTKGMRFPLPVTRTIIESHGQKESDTTEISFDDKCYKGIGDVRFSVQDENGLIGVKIMASEQLGNLLFQMGISYEKHGPLLDKLRDYQDSDRLLRLNGAEEREYKRAGKNRPANTPLLNPVEIFNVLGWGELKELWGNPEFRRLITVNSSGPPNFNTAPPGALLTIPRINDTVASLIVAGRKKKGYISLSELEASIGQSTGLNPFGLSFFSSYYQRITFWNRNGSLVREIVIKRTPMANKQRPWYVDYEITAPGTTDIALKSCESLEEIFSN